MKIKLLLVLVLSVTLTACSSQEEGNFAWDQEQTTNTESNKESNKESNDTVSNPEDEQVDSTDETNDETSEQNTDTSDKSNDLALDGSITPQISDQWTDQTCIDATRNLHSSLGYSETDPYSYAVMDQGDGTYLAEMSSYKVDSDINYYQFDTGGNYEEISADVYEYNGTQCFQGQPYGYNTFANQTDIPLSSEQYEQINLVVADSELQETCLKALNEFNGLDVDTTGLYFELFNTSTEISVVLWDGLPNQAASTRIGIWNKYEDDDFTEVQGLGSMSRFKCIYGQYN